MPAPSALARRSLTSSQDNLSNSVATSLKRVNQITGKPEAVTFCDVDLRDAAALEAVFAATSFETVIHFAAFKVRRERESCLLALPALINLHFSRWLAVWLAVWLS